MAPEDPECVALLSRRRARRERRHRLDVRDLQPAHTALSGLAALSSPHVGDSSLHHPACSRPRYRGRRAVPADHGSLCIQPQHPARNLAGARRAGRPPRHDKPRSGLRRLDVRVCILAGLRHVRARDPALAAAAGRECLEPSMATKLLGRPRGESRLESDLPLTPRYARRPTSRPSSTRPLPRPLPRLRRCPRLLRALHRLVIPDKAGQNDSGPPHGGRGTQD
jgi:hypothetical protein